jgi:hypothetical protein
MVIYTARDKRTPKKKQEEVNEWIGFFVKLVNEFQTKRYFRTEKSEKLRSGSKEKTYGCRMELFNFLGGKLFGAESFAEVVALFVNYHGSSFLDEVNAINAKVGVNAVKDNSQTPKISCADTLDVHYEARGSYSQQFAMFAAVKRKFPKGTLDFPTNAELVLHKRSLKVPSMKKFTNADGKTIGRVCNFMDLIKFQFGNKDIVRHCDFFIADAQVPKAVVLNHTDGARQSVVIELVSVLLRFPNLKDIARNPERVIRKIIPLSGVIF